MSFSDSARQVIAAVAPLIGTALAGPFGGLAGSFLASKLGTKPGDDKAIEAAVASGNPDVMVKLKEADDDFKKHIADIGLSEDQLAAQDRASARAREMAVKDRVPGILAGLVVLLTFALEGSLLMGWHQPAKVSGEILGRILGTLDSATILVLSYYFGSSATSRAKDDTINTLSKS